MGAHDDEELRPSADQDVPETSGPGNSQHARTVQLDLRIRETRRLPVDQEHTPGPGSRQSTLVVIAGLAVVLLVLVFALVRSVLPSEPSTAAAFEGIELAGQEWTEARQEIRQAGIGDNDYRLVEPESVAAASGVDLLVERVEIDYDDDAVTVHLAPDMVQFVAQLDLAGMSWPEAQERLTEAGLQQDTDYVVSTTGGEVYLDRNWSVTEVRNDGAVAEVVLTNSLRNQFEDSADDLGEWADGRWQDLRETWENIGDTFSSWAEEFEGLLP